MGSNRADVSELLSQCRWSEEGSYLGEVVKAGGFPCVVKVIRGQYQNIGQPSFSNPSLVSHLLLMSAGKQLSVAAQCVKFKNSRQRVVVPFGPTLAVPQNFEGHFEILSEDGRSVPCIQNVSALSRKFPDSCLVREAIKGYKPDPKSSSSSSPINVNPPGCNEVGGGLGGDSNKNNCNYKVSDKTRIVQPGEILVLVGEVCVPSGKKVSRYLRCFDSKGQTIFLNASQKGKFSPLARQDSIEGAHTIRNILNKRMPMMVRLVDGKPPVISTKSLSSFKFVPELRLFSSIQEELIFGMPLSQSSKDSPIILPLPLSVPLKFQVCRNMGEVEQMKEFCRLQEKIKSLVEQTKNHIQIYDINLKKELRFDGRQWKSYTPPIFLSPSTPEMILPGSTTHLHSSSLSPLTTANNVNNYEIPDVQDYEDIDEIYDYVRGIKPPPPSSSNNKLLDSPENHHRMDKKLSRSNNILHHHQQQQQHHHSQSGKGGGGIILSPTTNAGNVAKQRVLLRNSVSVDKLVQSDKPPEPPPIETIPTNKNKLLLSHGGGGSGGGGVSVSVGNIVKVAIQSDSKLLQQSSSSHNNNSNNNNNNNNSKNSRQQVPLHNHNHQTSIPPPPPLTTTTTILNTSTNAISANKNSHNNLSNCSINKDSNHTNSSSTNNSTPTNTSGSGSGVRTKHLYVKHNGLLDTSMNVGGGGGGGSGGGLSGSPTNRIIFRRSPIFDCRYKSMNDLNRSSLESGASVSSHKMRYFQQHNHHNGLNLLSGGSSHNNNSSHGNLNFNVNFNVKASARHKGIFRPKSMTNITMDDNVGLLSPCGGANSHGSNNNNSNYNNIMNINSSSNNNLGVVSKKKLDMVVPSHHHHPPPPPIELLHRSSQSQRSRKSQPATLYL